MTVTINGTTGVTTNNSVYTDASGNTGIGTTSPTSPLTVSATGTDHQLRVQNTGTAASDDAIILVLTNSTGTTSTISGFYFGDGDSNSIGQLRYNHSNDSMAFYTSSTEKMRIDTSGYVTNAVNGNGNGLVQAYQYYRLNSAYAGSNATGAQSMFGVGVTLSASTVYEFEYSAILTKTAGTTSHTFSILFGGTATLNNLFYVGTTANKDSSAMPFTTNTTFIAVASNSAAALTLVSGITSATESIFLVIKGTVSINAGGTFIPQYQLSAAPGGAYSTQIGSYIKISALSASGANTSVGTWA